ncbi:MAG: ABC transporter permease [Thermoproteota archaeon]|jgi:ABC-type dipeptide/oligopeptide/nickel transport systems, permease components
MGLKRFIISRIITMFVVIFIVAVINFIIFQVLPFTVMGIDPKTWFVPAGGTRNDVYINQIRQQVIQSLGLDLPLDQRFFQYIIAMFTFNFGYNVGGALEGPVIDTIIRFAPYTVLLLGTSTVISFIISIYLGIISAHKRGRTFDKISLITFLFFYAMPSFWIGSLLLLFFAFGLKWAPPNAAAYFSGLSGIDYVLALLKALALPLFSLTLISVGGFYLIMRNSAIDVITEDYIFMAKAKGLSTRKILFKHIQRNSILPLLTVFAISLGFVLSGAIITETIFGWPGLGYWSFVAIDTLDFPFEQAFFFIVSVMVVVANFIADILYGVLDPRIRTGW